ncbi:hypothetical protein [Jeotgalibacillus aurantiacus]|uniref:hypothetical protein n=1 Tax=Jeotgalibacillus aurantiacus TaxID=2763266 RepID=UPI001D0A6204|nr:hypothetical protein [Jeotgalibacillus aurantiacus]
MELVWIWFVAESDKMNIHSPVSRQTVVADEVKESLSGVKESDRGNERIQNLNEGIKAGHSATE